MSDDIRETLRINIDELGTIDDSLHLKNPTQDEVRSEHIQRVSQNYETLYSIPEVREYFNQVITAILLSHQSRFGKRNLDLVYRFKSSKSIHSKIEECIIHIPFNTDENRYIVDYKPMFDGFALKMITGETPSMFYSEDSSTFFEEDRPIPEILRDKKANYEFLERMQMFKNRLIEDEYDYPPRYKLEVSQQEYITNCIEILERTRDLIEPSETNVIDMYTKRIERLQNNLDILQKANMASLPITEDLLQNKDTDFIALLSNFERKMHNELGLAVFTKQIRSLFKNNPLFEQLGVSLTGPKTKEPKRMRTKNGYESNFIYINTLFGPIECQLQTEEQREQGRFGIAAHTRLPNKSIDLIDIPETPDNSDDSALSMYKSKIQDFMQRVLYISPRKYTASLKNDGRIFITEYGAYRNYYSISNEIPPDDPRSAPIKAYFARLANLLGHVFDKYPDRLLQYNQQDFNQYINSIDFSKAKEISKLWNSNMEHFSEIYTRDSEKSHEEDR